MSGAPGAAVVRRVVGFGAVPLLSVLSPLLVLPLLASRFGPDGWSTVAVGTSVGGAVSVVLGLSWPTVGAHLVASAADADARRTVYADSLVTRSAALVVLLPAAAVAAALVTPAHPGVAAVTAAAVTLNGLTCAWWFVGAGTPRALVVNEALPRLGATAVVAGLLVVGAGLWVYGPVLLAGAVVATVLNHRSIAGWTLPPRRPVRRVLADLGREHGTGTGARMLFSVYGTAAVSVVALAAPGAVPVFAAVDRLVKTATNGLYAVPQGLAGWVSGGDRAALVHRARRAVGVSAVVAVVTLAATWTLLPLAAHLLYAGHVEVTPPQRACAAMALAAAFLNQALVPVAMVPTGRQLDVYRSYALVAVIGVAALAAAAAHGGATGALAASAAVEVLLAAVLLARAAPVLAAPVAAAPVPAGPPDEEPTP